MNKILLSFAVLIVIVIPVEIRASECQPMPEMEGAWKNLFAVSEQLSRELCYGVKLSSETPGDSAMKTLENWRFAVIESARIIDETMGISGDASLAPEDDMQALSSFSKLATVYVRDVERILVPLLGIDTVREPIDLRKTINLPSINAKGSSEPGESRLLKAVTWTDSKE